MSFHYEEKRYQTTHPSSSPACCPPGPLPARAGSVRFHHQHSCVAPVDGLDLPHVVESPSSRHSSNGTARRISQCLSCEQQGNGPCPCGAGAGEWTSCELSAGRDSPRSGGVRRGDGLQRGVQRDGEGGRSGGDVHTPFRELTLTLLRCGREPWHFEAVVDQSGGGRSSQLHWIAMRTPSNARSRAVRR